MPKMTVQKKREILLRMCQLGDAIKKDELLVQNFVQERLSYIPHKKLYKFRECTNDNFETLSENCIWMPPANRFSDLFDSTINIDFRRNQKEVEEWLNNQFPVLCFEFSKKLCEDLGQPIPYTHDDFLEYTYTCLDENGDPIAEKEEAFLRKHTTQENLAGMDETLQQLKLLRVKFAEHQPEMFKAVVDTIEQIRGRMREVQLTYCMTEGNDNRGLWENYAGKYTGFCIEYSFERWRELPFQDYKNLAFLFPITYRKTRPYFNMVPFMDGAFRGHLYKDPSWQKNPELNTDLNMQLYYKHKDYEFEHEWRFSIKNAGNSKQYFPFVNALYAGKDIKEENLEKLCGIAERLSVPLHRQVVNKFGNGFDYIQVNRGS